MVYALASLSISGGQQGLVWFQTDILNLWLIKFIALAAGMNSIIYVLACESMNCELAYF